MDHEGIFTGVVKLCLNRLPHKTIGLPVKTENVLLRQKL